MVRGSVAQLTMTVEALEEIQVLTPEPELRLPQPERVGTDSSGSSVCREGLDPGLGHASG